MRNRWIRTAVVMVSLVGGGAAPTAAQEPGSVVASDSRVQGRTYSFPGTGTDGRALRAVRTIHIRRRAEVAPHCRPAWARTTVRLDDGV